MFDTAGEIIDALGGTGAVTAGLGIDNPSTVSSWRTRGIPAERWLDIAGLAQAAGVDGITVQMLALLHRKPAPESSEARA